MEIAMRTSYLVLPMLCAAPLLHGCASMTTAAASYGIKSVLDVRNSAETPEMYYDMGRYYQAQNRYGSAVRAYEHALALDPGDVRAASALGTCYAMQRDYDRAIATLQDAVRRAPGTAYLHNNLGYVYYLAGRNDEAVSELEAATRLDDRDRRAWRNLGLAYAKGGNAQAARDAHAKAAAATPQALLTHWRAAHPDGATSGAAKPEAAARDADATKGSPVPDAPGKVAGPSATLEVVPVAPSIYELRPIAPEPVLAASSVAAAATPQAPAATMPPLKPFRLDVSNGNGTTGMAHRVSTTLKHLGLNAVRLTNQIPWQRASEIQFSAGYALEAAKLAAMLSQPVLTVRNDRLRRDIQVRLVLGKDVHDETALVLPGDGPNATRVASVR
jgi:tetratricopeptide (TPR) repeat protein